MGKLCRIRLLRPEEVKAKEEGVSDIELAVLAGSSEDLTTSSPDRTPYPKHSKPSGKRNLKKSIEKSTRGKR